MDLKVLANTYSVSYGDSSDDKSRLSETCVPGRK